MISTIDPRWEPFRRIEEGTILASNKDFFAPGQTEVTLKPRQNRDFTTKLHDLFVLGRMKITSTNATLIFRTIYVFGTLELDGVNVSAARVACMTEQQFLKGFALVKNEPVEKPVNLNHLPAVHLSHQGERVVIRGDINYNLIGLTGLTSLMWAIHCRDRQLVKLFIYANADLEIKYKQWTALAYAALKKHKPIIEMLIEGGAQPASALLSLQKAKCLSAFNRLTKALTKYHHTPPNIHQTSKFQLSLPTLFEDQPFQGERQRNATGPKRVFDLASFDLRGSPSQTRLEIYRIAIILNNRRTPLTSTELSNVFTKMLNREFMVKHISDFQMYTVFLFINQQVQRLSLQQAVSA